jgi:hypothetical protein
MLNQGNSRAFEHEPELPSRPEVIRRLYQLLDKERCLADIQSSSNSPDVIEVWLRLPSDEERERILSIISCVNLYRTVLNEYPEDCVLFHDMMDDFARACLPEKLKGECEAHLSGCEACRKELAEMRALTRIFKLQE